MSEHTPGPWITTKAVPVMAGYSQSDSIASLSHNTLIAGCFHDVKGGPEVAEANARLIAAAPDLIAAFDAVDNGDWRALDLLLGHSGHGQFWRGVFNDLRAAIAKATGAQP